MKDLYTAWKDATANLPWGVQRAFHDVLTLAAEGKTTLVYNADYADKGACLVNQAGNMLVTGGGYGIPMQHFGPVVSLFDQINRQMANHNTPEHPNGIVSPFAAEVLLHYFAPLKDVPEHKNTNEHLVDNVIYAEPTDEQFAADLKAMFEAPSIPDEPEQGAFVRADENEEV